MRPLVLLFLAVISLASVVRVPRAVWAGPGMPAQTERPRDPSTLREPVSVEAVDMYRDGGTISVQLKDAEGRAARICFDHRMGTKTPGRLYIGVHPGDRGARLVPLAGREQERVLSTLRRHIRRQFSASELKELASLEPAEVNRRYNPTKYRAFLLLGQVNRLEAMAAKPKTAGP